MRGARSRGLFATRGQAQPSLHRVRSGAGACNEARWVFRAVVPSVTQWAKFATVRRRVELGRPGDSKGLFTDDDVWNGGFYELALEYERGPSPGLVDGLAAVWNADAVVGCYLNPRRDPHHQPRAAFEPSLPFEGHLYGVATLPPGKRVACGTCCVREDRGTDWLIFYCPMGSLERVYPVGGFPFGDDDHDSWRAELEGWLTNIAHQVFAAAPFRLGLIGFETSGELHAVDVLQHGVPAQRHCAVLVPTPGGLVLHPRPPSAPLIRAPCDGGRPTMAADEQLTRESQDSSPISSTATRFGGDRRGGNPHSIRPNSCEPKALLTNLALGTLEVMQWKIAAWGRRMAWLTALTEPMLAVACSSENLADWNQPGVVSPNGAAKARLMHTPGASSSQIYLTFDRGACGAGSISASGAAPPLKLFWRNATTLEVSAPHALHLQPAPAAQALNHTIKCGDRIVDVVVVRR